MALKTADPVDTSESPSIAPEEPKKAREILGNLPYTTSHGVLKKVLEGIIAAERPDKFSGNFMATVLKVSGGSARVIPPILKRMGFLGSDGSPTELYSKFKSDSGRSAAAFEGLRRAFPEMFRRSEFIHRAETDKVRDLVVEITGLNKQDQVVRAIVGTFQAIRDFVDVSRAKIDDEETRSPSVRNDIVKRSTIPSKQEGLSLVYNINIVLPDTTNVQVFNSIFRSLKDNLLGEDA
jgi:hypothetical protein